MTVIYKKGTEVKRLAEYLQLMCAKKDGKPVVLAHDVTILIRDDYDPVLVLDAIMDSTS